MRSGGCFCRVGKALILLGVRVRSRLSSLRRLFVLLLLLLLHPPLLHMLCVLRRCACTCGPLCAAQLCEYGEKDTSMTVNGGL